MGRYDYEDQICRDAELWMRENRRYHDDYDKAFGSMMNSDLVTGNLSGSYTCSTYRAAHNLEGLEPEFFEEYEQNTGTSLHDETSPEIADVLVRMYILAEMKDELEKYWNAL